MAILCIRGVMGVPYLDDILVKAPSRQENLSRLQIVLDTLACFTWAINVPKSSFSPFQRISFLSMSFDTALATFFLPQEKLSTLEKDVKTLRRASPISLSFCMQVPKTYGVIKAVTYAQFQTCPLHKAILPQ